MNTDIRIFKKQKLDRGMTGIRNISCCQGQQIHLRGMQHYINIPGLAGRVIYEQLVVPSHETQEHIKINNLRTCFRSATSVYCGKHFCNHKEI
jgi:hypothetical protein